MQCLQESIRAKVDFLSADTKKILQVDSITLVVCNLTGHAQSTQNKTFTISLQYRTENMKGEADFWLLKNFKGFFKVTISF